MDNLTNKGAIACFTIVLFLILSIIVSVAIGTFFGAGFGLIAYAIFTVFEIWCALLAFKKAGE